MRTRTLWKAVWPCRLGADPAPPLSPPRPRTRAARDGIGWDLRCGSDPTRQRREPRRVPPRGNGQGAASRPAARGRRVPSPRVAAWGPRADIGTSKGREAARGVRPVRLPARGVQEQSRASVAAEVGAAVILARWRPRQGRRASSEGPETLRLHLGRGTQLHTART